MRRCIVMLLIVMVSMLAWGAPGKEIAGSITVLSTMAEDTPEIAYAKDKLLADFPDVRIEMLMLDLSDGSTISMDALNASGQTPNVYTDYVGRVSKYMRPGFALPLNGYVRDLDKYVPGVLDAYTRDGDVLALPQPGGVQGMAINLEIMEAIGFEVTEDWTIDDFLHMAAMVKQQFDGEKWATGMFAGNQSGDYLINNWFAAFGAELYQNGDYSKTTIRETGVEKVYEFFQGLVENGYVPPGSAALVDDDYVLQWARGELAATAFFPGWVAPYQNIVKQQGYEPFEFVFMPFPTATGEPVPTYGSNAAILVHLTGTDNDTIAARFAEYLNSAVAQSFC